MIWFLRFLYQLALAVWLGETVFLSLVVAPVLFTQMPVAEAGRVMSLLFPFYYGIGGVCAAAIVLCAVFLWRRLGAASIAWAVGGVVAGLLLLCIVYAAAVVQPRLHTLRPAREAGDVAATVEFDDLHELSVQLNGAVLLGNLLILALVAQSRAWRAAPPEDAAIAA